MFKKFLPLFLLILSVSCLHAQTRAYVANVVGNTVSVIDTSTNAVTATIPVGNGPQGVVASPDGTRVYAINSSDSTVSVIDTGSNAVVATVPLASNSFPIYAAITPDGKSLYVAEFDAGNVEVVSTSSNSVMATIPVGGNADSAAVTPDGAHVYVLGEDFFSVIATATNTVSAGPVPVDSDPGQTGTPAGPPAFSLAGDAAYMVGGGGFNEVSVVSTASNTVTSIVTLPASAHPFGITITPDGSRLYVVDGADNVVDIIDAATNTLEPSTIPVGNNPVSLAVTPDGAAVYAVNQSDATVSVIATATNTVAATVPVGQLPTGIAIANLSSPFALFTIDNLVINNNLHEQGDFTLGSNTGGIDLSHQPLTLSVNNFSLTIPAGSFKQVGGNMHFVFNGTVNGLKVNFNLQGEQGSSTQFDFVVDVHGVNISGPDPANVGLKIGHNSGTTTAEF